MDQATILASSLQKFGDGRKKSPDAMLNVQTWLQEVISLCDQRMKKSDIQRLHRRAAAADTDAAAS